MLLISSSHLLIKCLQHIWTKLWWLRIIASTCKCFHHALSELKLAIGYFRVLTLVFTLVAEELSTGMQHIVATRPDAMYMVANAGKSTTVERTHLMLHKLLEAVSTQLLIFNVICLVLF